MKNFNDENKALGIFMIGVFLAALGNGLTRYIKDTSIKFVNGLVDGLGVGLQLVGIFLFAFGLSSIIRIKRHKK